MRPLIVLAHGRDVGASRSAYFFALARAPSRAFVYASCTWCNCGVELHGALTLMYCKGGQHDGEVID